MAPTFEQRLQKDVQLTIMIGKSGTQPYCKVQWIILVNLLMCTWEGLDECMMPSNSGLYCRWRCLLNRLDVDVNDASKVVAAWCVLHNICEIHGNAFDDYD